MPNYFNLLNVKLTTVCLENDLPFNKGKAIDNPRMCYSFKLSNEQAMELYNWFIEKGLPVGTFTKPIIKDIHEDADNPTLYMNFKCRKPIDIQLINDIPLSRGATVSAKLGFDDKGVSYLNAIKVVENSAYNPFDGL